MSDEPGRSVPPSPEELDKSHELSPPEDRVVFPVVEAQVVSSKLAAALHNPVADLYFNPKPFELEKVYKWLGVGLFKRYIPTTGDFMVQKVIRKFDPSFSYIPRPQKGLSRHSRLHGLETVTRTFEAVHLGMMALAGVLQIQAGEYTHGFRGAARAVGLQTIANVYPIMTQRYNRLRVHRILGRRESIPPDHQVD